MIPHLNDSLKNTLKRVSMQDYDAIYDITLENFPKNKK
jgi:hypothetical protein